MGYDVSSSSASCSEPGLPDRSLLAALLPSQVEGKYGAEGGLAAGHQELI